MKKPFPPSKDKRGLALDGQLKAEDTNLASSTILKKEVPKESMGIIVSYKVKVSFTKMRIYIFSNQLFFWPIFFLVLLLQFKFIFLSLLSRSSRICRQIRDLSDIRLQGISSTFTNRVILLTLLPIPNPTIIKAYRH